MTRFTPADFAPLDDFPLLWRWTRPTHDVLPSDSLATIRALTAERAASLMLVAAARSAEREGVEPEWSIAADTDAVDAVRTQLRGLGIDGTQQVVVSWDARAAVVTRWETFVAHWGAFCYPASDDVTVWAPSDDWTLCYRHWEVFEFGRSRGAA